MRKLSYISMSLAALAIQSCVTVQAATTQSAPSAAVNSGAAVATTAATAAASATTAAVGEGINLGDQYAQVAGAAATKAKQKATKSASNFANKVANAVQAASCKVDSGTLCGMNAAFAIQEMQKCYNHPKKAKNCFNNICTMVKMAPTAAGYNPQYIAAVAPSLSKYPKVCPGFVPPAASK
jgi:hypothetical protein